jgi:hypothetical protein
MYYEQQDLFQNVSHFGGYFPGELKLGEVLLPNTRACSNKAKLT